MKRVAELDGLRGLAVAAVVAFHFWPEIFPWGWAAVDLFFVLSGYLITLIILENGGKPGFLKSFYARRGLRIWPIYYLTLAALYVASCYGLVDYLGRDGLLAHALYVQDVPAAWGDKSYSWSPLRHCWTLAIEEQFYLVWPALILFFPRRTVLLAAAALATSVAWRVAGGFPRLLGTRCDGLAMGAFLAALVAGRRAEDVEARVRPWVVGALAIGLPLLAFAGFRQYRLGLTPFGEEMGMPWADVLGMNLLAFAAVATASVRVGHPLMRPLRWPPLVGLGVISYGVYLYHRPVQVLWPSAPSGVPGLWRIWAYGAIAFTVALALVSWYCVERPLLSLKRYFTYRHGANDDPPPARRGAEVGTPSVG